MKNVILSAPTHVELTITEMCNHKCKHCYNAWRSTENIELEFDESKIDYVLNELIHNKVSYVTITGGEPLIRQKRMFHIIERLKKNNIGIGLNTNISLIDDNILDKLVNKYEWENTILTSLPGFTEKDCDSITQVKGSFVRICKGIEKTISSGICVGINIVITKNNIEKLDDLTKFLCTHKISTLALTRVVPPVYNSEDNIFRLDEKDVNVMMSYLRHVKMQYGINVTSLCSLPFCLLENKSDIEFLTTKCGAGIIGCSINCINGRVSPCAHNEETYGNIYEDSLKSIWTKMNKWREGEFISKECRKCKMISYCGGDCRLNNQRYVNKPYKLDSNCDIGIIESNFNVLISMDVYYNFNNKTNIREEEFGAVISLGTNEFYVKQTAYSIIKFLKAKQKFSMKEIEKVVTINNSLSVLLNKLIQAEIIYE